MQVKSYSNALMMFDWRTIKKFIKLSVICLQLLQTVLDPNQAQQDVWPDLNPRPIVFLKEFFENVKLKEKKIIRIDKNACKITLYSGKTPFSLEI